MAIPDYQTLMLPLLRICSDRKDWLFRDAVARLADEFQLNDDERVVEIPSGGSMFAGRVAWARTYLKAAGLIESPKRGTFCISSSGIRLLQSKPLRIDNKILDQYEGFRSFRTRSKDSTEPQTGGSAEAVSELTPEEAMASAYQKLRKSLESELLERIKTSTPAFFERVVVDLLIAMGYGGSRTDAGRAVGRSGDGGIDGIINEDKLGLDVIYLQAKRWDSTVGRPEIQKFAGALQGHRASKGVFITTSNYSREAIDYASVISSKIILIDGERLTNLMVEHGVAVAKIGSYEIKRIDSDYFETE